MYEAEAQKIVKALWLDNKGTISQRIARAIEEAYIAGYRQGKDDTLEAVRFLKESK